MTEGTASGGDDALLAADDVRVVRGAKTILRGVTVRARAGEIVGVLGPSGAGKSTLFRALVGEIPIDSGRVAFDGRDVTAAPLWRRAREGIAYVPQTPSVLWDLSVRENLRVYRRIVYGGGNALADGFALVRRILGRTSTSRSDVDGDREDRAIESLARRVTLGDRLDVRAGALSGGERRRLELARALTRGPKVLVCDEPFAAIDPKQAVHVGDMLQELAASGVAVLLADHHVAEALRICTRAILLLDGEIALEADPDAFREAPLVVGRYLGSWQRSLPPSSRT